MSHDGGVPLTTREQRNDSEQRSQSERERTTLCKAFVDTLFPFRFLSPDGAQSFRSCFEGEEVFCSNTAKKVSTPSIPCFFSGVLIMYLLMAGSTLYVLFATSSWKPVLEQIHKNGTTTIIRHYHEPVVGGHWEYCLCVKYVLQVVLLHYLCREIMQPQAHIKTDQYRDPQKLNEPGVLLRCYSCCRCLTGTPYSSQSDHILESARERAWEEGDPKWLTVFTLDHLLLFLVGACYFIMQYCFLQIGLNSEANGDEKHYIGPYALITGFVLAEYVGFLILGFLWNSLEYFVKPRENRLTAFTVTMMILLVFCSVEFLVVSNQRQQSTGFATNHVKLHLGGSLFRNPRFLGVVCTLGQVFVTHSLVMLGAVLLGHSSHFQRSPDLTCCGFVKVLIVFLLASGVFVIALFAKSGHHWPECAPLRFQLAVYYNLAMPCVSSVGGLFLLLLACYVGHCNVDDSWRLLVRSDMPAHSDHAARSAPTAVLQAGTLQSTELVTQLASSQAPTHPLDESEVVKTAKKKAAELFDYDSTLIMLTSFAAASTYLSEMFKSFADGTHWSFSLAIFAIIGQLGLAVFVLCAWHMKSYFSESNPETMKYIRHFKIGLYVALFLTLVNFIDFQIMEECEITSVTPECCRFPSFDARRGGEFIEGKHVPSEMWNNCARETRCRRNESSVWCNLPEEEENEKDVATSTDATCTELEDRWNKFVAMSDPTNSDYNPLLVLANQKEEELLSSSYKIFAAVGNAGSVEFHFTLIGIILKTIMVMEHPNREKILRENAKGHDH